MMMLAPALQAWLHLIPEKGLRGDFVLKEKPILDRSSWMDASFQTKFDPWMEENIGFHNTLVRTNNQLDYSFFHLLNNDEFVRGRNGQLYEYDYIRAWMGVDFVGEKLLDKKLRQFRYLQKYLKEKFDTELILVLEPGKASVYPDDIPSRYTKAPEGKSNYDYISVRAKELGINMIDFNEYFVSIRDSIEYPIFPRQGTHWSEFAMWYAADSLLNYIESTKGIRLRRVIKEDIEYSKDLRSSDYDVGHTLNLLFELQHPEMPYPNFSFEADSSMEKPNVLVIADSYYWNIFNTRLPKRIFNNEAFWYFYKEVYPESYYGKKTVDQLELNDEIEKQDVIFFMSTERFLYKFDRGFVDDAWKLYGLHSDTDPLTSLQTLITNLDSWFAEIIIEAHQDSITLGEQMENEANFMLWETQAETYYSIYGPEPLLRDIQSDSSWFADVQRRAANNNQSIEERLLLEAAYMLSQKYPDAYKKYVRVNEISELIRADSSWHTYILKKAAENFMTEEEMIRVDAEYVYWQESR